MIEKTELDIDSWIEAAGADTVEYHRRQAVEVLLWAVSYSTELRGHLYLKGGALMNLVHQSPRMTQDVDFTTTLERAGAAEKLQTILDRQMAVAAADLGYVGMRYRVQAMKMKPPDATFSWPTLEMKIGMARKGSRQEKKIETGSAANVLKVDISFNEKVLDWQEIRLLEDQHSDALVLAYTIYQQIAEKLRAIIQQPIRNRYRRQDIFDIAQVLSHRTFDENEKRRIFDLFLKKSQERNIQPVIGMLDDPELYRRSRERYENLEMDSGNTELDFDQDFALVKQFYCSLPWRNQVAH